MTNHSENKHQPLLRRSEPLLALRGAHLDLKGMPPTAERLLELPAILAAGGYNIALVEWEDTFPWNVDTRFRNATAYTPETVTHFADTAAKHGIEIISLIQCMGHMETPLGVAGYEHMREIADDPDTLNPLAPGARELVESMVDDILRLLPQSRYLHMGGDEASLGKHPATAAYIAEHGKGALYLQHVEPILERLNARGIRPILWHDMMVHWDDIALRRLAPQSDLMVWGYNGHPDTTPRHFNSRHIQRFSEQGLTLWGASAFKGADGASADLPTTTKRLENAAAWVEVAQRFSMKGVVATGWSRYSTLYMQCEPLEVALDTLLASGVLFHDGALPPDSDAALSCALESLGENKRFQACREAFGTLSAVRQNGWQECRTLAELLALHNRFSPRGHGKNARQIIKYLGNIMKTGEEAETQVRQALAGRVAPIWIDEYLHTRLAPLRAEYKRIAQEWQELLGKSSL